MSKDFSKNKDGVKISFKKIVVKSCCIFTVLVFALYLLTTIILGNGTFTTNIGNTAALFALSFVLSSVTVVLNEKRVSFLKSNLILFITVGAVYFFIVVCLSGMHKNVRGTLTAMGIYLFSFAVYITVKLFMRKSKNKRTESEKDKEYESKF